MKLKQEELINVNGGVFKLAAGKILVLGGIAVFVIGLIGGYTRPSTCSSGK
ncbi:MAG: class IIb bacteriocin, lactobin A/cerein 7B family [Bacilli bacterium]|nr:class IIb bacteriocin, lactobin A/cerein 7B family [Bacilli bacterium]